MIWVLLIKKLEESWDVNLSKLSTNKNLDVAIASNIKVGLTSTSVKVWISTVRPVFPRNLRGLPSKVRRFNSNNFSGKSGKMDVS